MKRCGSSVIFCMIVLFTLFAVPINFSIAQSDIQQLQRQIQEKNSRLSEIEEEIAQYKAALEEVGAEKSTLQNAIYRLETERKKVQADIAYTENKINATDLQIQKLTLEIEETEFAIKQSQDAIRAILREMYISDNQSFIEVFLQQENIAAFWNEYAELEKIKESMRQKIAKLKKLKTAYETKRSESTSFKQELVNLKSQYVDQNAILRNSKAEKAKLLAATKNEEANYQTLLQKKIAARDKLLAEVRDIESQIQFILDPNTIPAPGTPVFRWPLEKPIRITQYFGYTKFARSGAYGGNQHNGMDMAAPVGTKAYAPLSGTVRMTGNTDLVPGCYSWGKWVLIDHPNGLSTLFAHLSQPAVVPGQKVKTGDVVAYTGNTGYSTGPHLHYTVYVTEGVEVKQFNQFKKVTSCGAALSPFAAIEAYQDPLDFLPPL